MHLANRIAASTAEKGTFKPDKNRKKSLRPCSNLNRLFGGGPQYIDVQ